MTDDEDYNIKRGKHMEQIGDQHSQSQEYLKAAKLYRDSFNHFKKAGDKASCLRLKEKFEKSRDKAKENQ